MAVINVVSGGSRLDHEEQIQKKSFDEIVSDRIEAIKSTLASKAKEYVQGGDRFYNFNRAAELNNTRPATALWGMATKHLVSVIDMVEGNRNNITYSNDHINEKIGDMINYLILLEGLLKEEG